MDMHWLANEAKQLHFIFTSFFNSMVLTMIVGGVVVSFFKMPLGQVPEFLTLVGRAIIASFILAAFPEILNFMADLTDNLAATIGNLNNFKLVLSRLGAKIGQFTWSWVSVKDSVLLIISYLTFFLLYVSVYVADAAYLLVWTLLYIFSPILIAAFTLPSLASATKGLFMSLIEVCLWKVLWSCLAALLWSFALSEINKPEYDVDFLTAILLNLLLAFSVLLTPMLVRSFLSGKLTQAAQNMGGMILGAAALTPTGMLANSKALGVAAVSKMKSNQSEQTESEVKRTT
ncbi:MAG: hypothetical protein JNL11_10955 [Bdellovibrionaceae bacterium]|nr:hypothetical protein [Pseudobdellovibrionaceae bacterium]